MQTPPPLTYHQQLCRVVILAVGFTLMFIAFTPLENMITKLYEDMGHSSFGPLSLAIVYGTFSISTAFSSSIIRTLGINKTLMIGALGYACFDSSGFAIGQHIVESEIGVLLVMICGALACGMSASCIWVAQGMYIGHTSEVQYRDAMFGVFWGIRTMSSVIGYLLTTFVLGKLGFTMFYCILIPVAISSIFVFWSLPQVQLTPDDTSDQRSPTQRMSTYFKLLLVRQNSEVYSYALPSGITGGLTAVLLYRLALQSIPRDEEQTEQDWKMRQNLWVGMFFLCYGVTQSLTGFAIHFISKHLTTYQMAFYGSMYCAFAAKFTFVAYHFETYWLSCICSVMWGFGHTFNRSLMGSLFSIHFKNSSDHFAISYFINSGAFAASALILPVFAEWSLHYSIIIILLIFIWISRNTKRLLEKETKKLEGGEQLEENMMDKDLTQMKEIGRKQ